MTSCKIVKDIQVQTPMEVPVEITLTNIDCDQINFEYTEPQHGTLSCDAPHYPN